MTRDKRKFIALDMHREPGAKVKANHLDWGRYWDIELAERFLEHGKTYTVANTEVYSFHTDVYLEEFPGVRFNSVHFVDVR